MSTYSTNLKIELIGTGEQVGTWGSTTNSNFANVFEQAIVGQGTVNFPTDANVTMTYTDSVASQLARNVYLNLTSSGSLSATRDLIVPTINKNYVIQNNTTGGQSITVKTVAGTGITVPNGFTCALYVDGTNVIQAFDFLPTLTIGALNVTTLDLTNLEVTNIKAKDGTASASIADSTGAFTVSAPFAANGGTTIGDASGDAFTINSSAVSIPNGLTVSGGTTTFNNNQVISVTDNSNAALRIIQLGSGNALLVEDDANPDSTPFVINNTGYVVSGSPTVFSTGGGSVLRRFQSLSTSASGSDAGFTATDFSNDSTSNGLIGIFKSRGTTVGSMTIVQAQDRLGVLNWGGADGSNMVNAARIEAYVDGTPGTNDMPGRLVFSTTPDGSSTPTERMRIDNVGRLTLGGGSSSSSFINIVGTMPVSAPDSIGVNLVYTIPSTSTSSSRGFFTQNLSTQAAAFTLPTFRHFEAGNITLGAGSSLTEQIGFRASGMTSGTNVFGFKGDVVSGTGRFNLYMDGTASNFIRGTLGVGTASGLDTRQSIRIGKQLTGDTTAYGVANLTFGASDVTSALIGYYSALSTATASYTLNSLHHYQAAQGAIGAGSTVTTQIGYLVDSSLVGGTNNYGFYSNIASGTGRWNFYANGTAANYFGGATTIETSSTDAALRITQTGSGNALLVEDSSNPDGTPFVIDSSGLCIQGSTSFVNTPNYAGTASSFSLQTLGTITSGTGYVGHSFGMFNNSTAGAGIFAVKSRSGTVGGQTVVNANDKLFAITAAGSDGTNFIRAADISFEVDGTPGTNDMPGRLVFSTTADGASSPTERMRIDSAGRIGIGAASTDAILRIGSNLTGGANLSGVAVASTAQSDVSSARGFNTFLSTQATAFTLPFLFHYRASQGTIGAGSTLTNQYGFFAESTLTGATNNYGFFSNIASGTGRYNFYASGTADNYFAGNTTIAGTTTLGAALQTGLGVSTGSALIELGNQRTGDGNAYIDFHSQAGGDYQARIIKAGGANSSFFITNEGTGLLALNQLGAGAIILNTNGSERMRIDSSGNLGIGVTPSAWLSSTARAIQAGTGYFYSALTGNNLDIGSNAYYDSLGAYRYVNTNSAVRYQQISGQHQWFTAPSGTAGNAITFTQAMTLDASGNLGIRATSPNAQLTLKSPSAAGTNSMFSIQAAGSTDKLLKMTVNQDLDIYSFGTDINVGKLAFETGGTERMRIDSSGNLLVGTTATGAYMDGRTNIQSAGTSPAICAKLDPASANPLQFVYSAWAPFGTGNNIFMSFETETSPAIRGSIDYNRGAGQVRYNTTSDATLKNLIGDSDKQKSVEILGSTRIREYAWKDDAEQKPQIGVIAQELYETYKGAVSVGGEDEDGNYKPWTVDKTAFTFHLVAGWQEHQRIIQEQQAIITDLKARIETLESR